MVVRAVRRLSAVTGCILLVGCYTLQPLRGPVPEPGTAMAFNISDVGRVALGGLMGPEILQIEGRLSSRTATEYVVAVTDVHLLGGGDQVWHGEPVTLKSEYVSSLYERRFSATRSVALAAAGAGAIAAIAAKSLGGLGSVDRPQPGPGPGDTAHTSRRPGR
jgi:hypothetical protein